MGQIKILIILFLIVPNIIFSQQGSNAPEPKLPEVIPPSPTVASLMQFEEVPISYYTGQPNIALPIHTKKIARDLSIGISLNYNTQGVKINNTSGWTGTGWSLVAGGSISRTVRDVPDEKTINSTGNKVGILHTEYMDYESMSQNEKTEFNWNSIGAPNAKFDKEHDIYQFSFLGYSGRFVILEESNNLYAELITKNQNFDIEIFHNTDFAINKFIVTDTKGYKYTFDVVEETTSYPFGGTKQQGTNPGDVNINPMDNVLTSNSAWHLSKIETSNTKVLAQFNYSNQSNENYIASVSRSWNNITTYTGNLTDMLQNDYNTSIMEPKRSFSYYRVSVETKKLNEISFVDNTSVVLQSRPFEDHPETGGKILDKILLKDQYNTTFKTFSLDYETTTDYHFKFGTTYRLWLTKLTEQAGGLSNEYILDYNNKGNLPGFDAIEIDKWGYYSGIGTPTPSCSSNSPFDGDLIATGLLNSIVYPTGGAKEFVFEHNRYSFIQQDTITYEKYMQNPFNQSAISQTGSVTYQNPTNLPMTISSFTTPFSQSIYLSSIGVVTQNNTSGSGNPLTNTQILDNYALEINGHRVGLNESCALVSLAPGTYDVTLVSLGDIYTQDFEFDVDIELDMAQQAIKIKKQMIGGGVRIKKVLFKDNPNSSTNEKEYIYSYSDKNDSSFSSGVIDSENDALEESYPLSTTRYLFGEADNTSNSFAAVNINYNSIQKEAKVHPTQSAYIGYRHVKVSEANNGYSSFEFTSPFDFPSDPETFNYPYTKPLANIDYRRGLSISEKKFDESGKIVREVSFLDSYGNLNYEFEEDFLYKMRNPYKSYSCPYIQFYSHYDFFENSTPQNLPTCENGFPCGVPQNNCGGLLLVKKTDFTTTWAKLKGKTTKNYFYLGATPKIVETSTSYTYNNDNFQIAEENTFLGENQTNDHYQTKYYYPVSTNIPSYYQGSSTSITRLNQLNKVNEVLISQQYKNGVKLSETHTQYFEPITNLVLPNRIKTAKGDNDLESRITYHRYDSYGNPIELSKIGGARTSYVWGYNGQYPIAKIENSTYANLPTQERDEFIAFSNDPTKTEQQVLAKMEAFRNQINSLPSNTLVTTMTYKPLVGMSSVTDPKGDTQFFEYDEFGRLERVKDEQGNLLSENEYHYRTQN